MATSTLLDRVLTPAQDTKSDFVKAVKSLSGGLSSEISERNSEIETRDGLIYGNQLESSIDIPVGHDFTPVNWLKRTVEIHKTQFMSRGFQLVSTYNAEDPSNASTEDEKIRVQIESKKQKEFAELRKNAIDDIIRDNGGYNMFLEGAESASAVGSFIIKAWYDEKNKKYVLSPVEAVENCSVLWSKDDFRQYDLFAYSYQISRQKAAELYGITDEPTTDLGAPANLAGTYTPSTQSNQKMVDVMEITGKVEGWASDKGRLREVPVGQETELNALIVGSTLYQLIDNPKRVPKYYIFPNKRVRRRAWGVSDISDAAININVTYIETLSDWRTVAAKVNFPKYKGFGFGPDTQVPKPRSRQTQILPLAEGQDVVPLDQGDANQVDFRAQLEELKEQFVRETGISRVLFDDPSVSLNSNQALLTSMKPTSDIAENKKQLWGPILMEMFTDALETVAEYDDTLKGIIDEDWNLKVQWPSVMQKEDPVYQQMLLNRFNAGTMSLQTYLENQGETKEEIDRIRNELDDPVTAAIVGRQLGLYVQNVIAPPSDAPADPKVNVSLRGDLTPSQEANLAYKHGFNNEPFPPTMGPQGGQGLIAQENVDNEGLLTGNAFQGGKPIYKNPEGQTVPGVPQINTQANNQEGTGVVSQPGSGATPVSPEGALNQVNQQSGA